MLIVNQRSRPAIAGGNAIDYLPGTKTATPIAAFLTFRGQALPLFRHCHRQYLPKPLIYWV
ncbi:hypothetical protein M5G15_23750 [Pseudomonas shahriarae]|nr:hypothetical protein [Pseudomonas shahriarae]